mmetsp:Transcript_2780/g.5292  ORF Transcript_2780/g.5292 Transcript_2780/m.5292 type:complete len:141 (-) Transcript_2780:154-576(-)
MLCQQSKTLSSSSRMLVTRRWHQKMEGLKKTIKERKENKLTAKQEKLFFNWVDVLKVRNKVTDHKEKFLIDLYTQMPPRRRDLGQSYIKAANLKDGDMLFGRVSMRCELLTFLGCCIPIRPFRTTKKNSLLPSMDIHLQP